MYSVRTNPAYANKQCKPVTCGGCTACCKSDIVPVVAALGDDPSLYQTRIVDGLIALAVKPGSEKSDGKGDCIYRSESGCSIHDKKRPVACQVFDCRIWAQRHLHHKSEMVRKDPQIREVFQAAIDRKMVPIPIRIPYKTEKPKRPAAGKIEGESRSIVPILILVLVLLALALKRA